MQLSFRTQELLLPNSEAFSEMDDNLLVNDAIIQSPTPVSPNQSKAFLTNDGIQIMEPKPDVQNETTNLKFLSKEIQLKKTESQTIGKPADYQNPIDLRNPLNISTDEPDNNEENKFVEFKISPRPVFSTSCCQVCKMNIVNYHTCKDCLMVSYCKDEHLKMDIANHRSLCMAIEDISKKRGECNI